ncbi:MAG: SpoIIE family protein phosphatase, partial [Micrococcales bacterium]|nr:SpoIIE family protein phosphatase [Micrococcales bacterium]
MRVGRGVGLGDRLSTSRSTQMIDTVKPDNTTRDDPGRCATSELEPARPRRARHRLPEDVLRLQQALLPTTVPLLPRADLAAAYLPATDPNNVGGDWFDAAHLPDGRLVLAVGEVVGGGLESVATMGQIRAVLAARLYDGGSLLESIRAVETLA